MGKKCLKQTLLIGLFALFLLSSCEKNVVTNLTLNLTSTNFIIGQSDSIIASVTASGDISKFPVNWTTSDTKVVSVVNGKIKGLSSGTAIITAKSGDITATCEVTVNNEIAIVLDNGHLLYYGDAFESGVSNLFELAIAGPNDTLYFLINAPLIPTTQLAIGDYKVLTSIDSLSDLIPFSIIPGELYNEIKYYSWYFGSVESPLINGDLNVTSINKDNYNIELNFKDGFGNTIYGSFQGTIYYHDESASLASVPSAIKSNFNFQKPLILSPNLKVKKFPF